MQSKKWHVLIVDDEFRIGTLIKKLIHWDELNLDCMAVVDNGGTAFEIIQSESCPNVVITDIRMPKINGLELIIMTKELQKDMKFIVISGYKEFEYAHQALKYGVEDYLLKPVSEDELNHVLKKISEELSASWQSEQEQRAFKETVSESRHIIKRDFLKNIIETEEPEVVDDRVEFQGEIYRGIDIKLDYVDYNKKDKKQDKLTTSRIEEIVERILKTETEEVLICEKENLHIYCLFNYDFSKSRAIKDSVNDIMMEIKDYLLGFEQYEVTIGIGTERKEFAEIRFSIKEAHRAVGNRIKQGTGRIIYAETIQHDGRTEEGVLTEEWKEQIRTSIESYSVNKLEQCINQVYSEYKIREKMDFSGCYDMAEEIVNYFFDYVEFQQEEENGERKSVISNCQHCYTISGLKHCLKNSLGKFVEKSKEAAEAESVKPIRQARKYMEDHYDEKIVLEDLAEIVGLNPVYFSVLLKKETGINVSAYLLNIRIEKAKEFLCNTNETIAAIGDRVGYKDSRYFSQIFTKQVGVKPALYRKLHS